MAAQNLAQYFVRRRREREWQIHRRRRVVISWSRAVFVVVGVVGLAMVVPPVVVPMLVPLLVPPLLVTLFLPAAIAVVAVVGKGACA
jgi:hypothetical protein